MHVIDTSGMTREKWLALRRQSIGASDAPVIAGLSKYKSRFALWLEKTGQMVPEEAGQAARWGSRLEDDIEEELGLLGIKLASRQLMIAHPEWPWITATLDGVDDVGDLWEFKSAGFQTAAPLLDGVVGTLPAMWIIQAHHQMFAAMKPRVRFAVFIGHRLQLFTFCVERDESIISELLALLHEFRAHIENDTPPTEFDPEDAALLLQHYKRIEPIAIDLDAAEYGPDIDNFREASQELKCAAKVQKKAKARLLAAMKDAQLARCNGAEMKRSQVDVRAQTKLKSAYSYVKFTMSGVEEDD